MSIELFFPCRTVSWIYARRFTMHCVHWIGNTLVKDKKSSMIEMLHEMQS